MIKKGKKKEKTHMSVLHDGLLSNLKVTGVLTAGRLVGRELFINGAVPNRVLVGTTHGVDSLPAGTAGQILTSAGSGSIPQWENIAAGGVTSVTAGNSISVTGTATDPVVNVSGTTNHSVLLGNALGAVTSLANGSTGQILTAQTGADPIWAAAAGGVASVTGGNNITITGTATNPIVNVSGTTLRAVQVGNASGSLSSLPLGTTGQVLTGVTGNAPTWGAAPVASVTGGNNITITGTATAPVVNVSGTTNNSVLLGNATNSITSLANGSVGQVLTATAGTPAWTANVANIQGDSGGSLNAATVSILSGTGSFANNTINFVGSGGNTLRINASDTVNVNTVIGISSTCSGTNAVSLGNSNNASGAGVAIGRNCTSTGGVAIGTGVSCSTRSIAIGGDGASADNKSTRIGYFDDIDPFVSLFIEGSNNAIVGGTALTVDLVTQQIGIASSAKRYKENIKDIDPNVLNKLHDLHVVSFNYKTDEKKNTQYGLIAEDVAKILPQFVVCKKGGIIETVRYDQISVLLLAEVQRLRLEITELRKLLNK
jgi:hypothetical protein